MTSITSDIEMVLCLFYHTVYDFSYLDQLVSDEEDENNSGDRIAKKKVICCNLLYILMMLFFFRNDTE